MSSQFTYVLKPSRHKKKIRRQMIVASSDVSEKIKPVRVNKALVYTGAAVISIALGLSIGYFANEAGIIKGFSEGISARNERISSLEAENASLRETVSSKESEIMMLSQTIQTKTDEIEELNGRINSQYLPTDFPMSGSATMSLNTEDDIPTMIFSGTKGDFCRAAASGTVIEIRTNTKEEDDGSIAEYYVAGEETQKQDDEVKDLGFRTVITIDHGNGYCTVYFNDGDAVVSEGDKISAGNTLYNLDSNNTSVGYRIILNGEYVNPEEVMIISG